MTKYNGIGFGETRFSNTGLKSQTPPKTPNNNKKGYEISVDYLTITASFGTGLGAMDLIHLVEGTLNEKFAYSPSLGSWDGKSYKGSSSDSLRGTRIYSNPPTELEPFGEIKFKIPGKALSAAANHEIRDMCIVMSELWSATCSRIDVAIDDYSKVLSLDDVKSAQDAGNFAYVETTGYYESGERGRKEKGRTITFGSRQSQSYLRVYDKNVQSAGEIDAIRYEVEFKDDKAQTIFQDWCAVDFSDDQSSAKLLAGAALGAVRFCDRSTGERNLDRLTDLPWYKRLCDSVVTGYRLRVRKKETFLDDAMDWVQRAVVPTLAMIREYMGDEQFFQYIYDKTEEHTPFLSLIKREKIKQQQQHDREQQQHADSLRKYIVIGEDGSWCVT